MKGQEAEAVVAARRRRRGEASGFLVFSLVASWGSAKFCESAGRKILHHLSRRRGSILNKLFLFAFVTYARPCNALQQMASSSFLIMGASKNCLHKFDLSSKEFWNAKCLFFSSFFARAGHIFVMSHLSPINQICSVTINPSIKPSVILYIIVL